MPQQPHPAAPARAHKGAAKTGASNAGAPRRATKQKQTQKQSQTQAQIQALELLRPGQSAELLKELHILTRDGAINQDSRRKLKQVYHLFGFIEPLLAQLHASGRSNITLADHGAGKSYLGFILYDLFFKQLGSGTVYGIETRPELVEKSTALAQQLGFARMQFLALSVQQASASSALPDSFDVVTALHACDTATDDAIAFALQKNAQHLVLVPCCQAEAAACLRQHKAEQLARTPLAELWRHPLHTREIGSQLTNVMRCLYRRRGRRGHGQVLTNVMRCLYLEALGYRVTVTELVGWEHSMKNELILASYTGQKKRSAATRMHSIAESFGLQDWLQTRFPWVMQINQTLD